MNDSLNADPKLIDQNHSSSFGGWTRAPKIDLCKGKNKKKKQKKPKTKNQKKKQKKQKKTKNKNKNQKPKTNEKAQLVLLKLRNYPVVSSDQAILDITVHIDP